MYVKVPWALLALLGGAACCAAAQPQPADQPDVQADLRRLAERLEALESRHQADQERIRELEARLAALESSSAPTDEASSAALSPSAAPAASTPAGALAFGSSGGGNLLNPEITVFLDTGGSLSSDGGNHALNRFNLREVEIDFRAAISPTVDGVVIVALHEEIESDFRGDVEIDYAVEIEEGYLDFHTLPGDLAARAGKFRSRFGRNNLLHTHDLPQVTRPLALAALFGPEGMSSTGVGASWLVPNPFDKYLEFSLEAANADGGHHSPILGGPNADNPAVIAHLKFFTDVGRDSSLELGGSYMYAKTASDSDFDANVFGIDATWQWIHPDPSKFRSVLVQGEAFWADNDVDRGLFGATRNSSFGAYLFGQYQLDRDWYVGLRGDYTEYPNSPSRGLSDSDYAISPYLTWYPVEFLRVRLEYQHRWSDYAHGSGQEDAVFLQFTGVIGAHPPHPYWVHR